MATVAIIEDSSLVIEMLTMVCEGEGYDVVSFEEFGPAAASLGDTAPDIVITDLNLPDLDEGTTLESLRAIKGLESTPVIIISGRPRQELEELAEESGAQGALSKDDGMPVISSELPPMIEDLI